MEKGQNVLLISLHDKVMFKKELSKGRYVCRLSKDLFSKMAKEKEDFCCKDFWERFVCKESNEDYKKNTITFEYTNTSGDKVQFKEIALKSGNLMAEEFVQQIRAG